MHTLAVVILTLMTSWAILYGVWRLALCAVGQEMDGFRGGGLTASLEEPITSTVRTADGTVVTASDPGRKDSDDDGAAAGRGMPVAAVVRDGRGYILLPRS